MTTGSCSAVFPPPRSRSGPGGRDLETPSRLRLSSQASALNSESFCRGFSIAASNIGNQPVIGHGGLPLILLPSQLPADAYRLCVQAGGIRVEASSAAGFQYAGTALGQLIETGGDRIPECVIEDAPAFPVRGFMLDISRDKVPTMATLFELIDQLAAWRFNHLELYTEHTFAYQGHETVWKQASPMTAEEIRRLDDYCRMLNIELVPNQNSFGHLQRWLKHPAYRHLAEAPDGYVTPWGERRDQPFSLNPLLPESLHFLSSLYDELLPNFTSGQFNIGGDETFDLGQGASRAACEVRGKGRVYLDFLNSIKRLVDQRGKTMLFWGDIILNHPELIPELDRNAIALVWGYEADHPFEEQCRRMAESGMPFWVCPGTSTWNSIAGRVDNAFANLDAAAREGLKNGAGGILITEWGDNGHWQTRPFSRFAMAAGAYTAWHGHAPGQADIAALFPWGRTALELGNLYLDAGFPLHNTSPLFPLIRFSDPSNILARWTPDRLEATLHHAQTIAAQRDREHSPQHGDRELRLEFEEVAWAAGMLQHALKRGIWLKTGRPATDAPDLLNDILLLKKEFQRIWLARNREGGMSDSILPLTMRRQEYETRVNAP